MNFPEYKGENYFSLQLVKEWKLPNEKEMLSAGTTISGMVNDSTSSVMPVMVEYPGYQSNFFGNFPAAYTELKFTEELSVVLTEINSDFADTWNAAWEQLMLEKKDSVKNSSTNARTVVDEISWIPDPEHLKKLPWCELDDKGKPIRACSMLGFNTATSYQRN